MENNIDAYQDRLVYIATLGALLCAFLFHQWRENQFQWWNLLPHLRGRTMRKARREWVRRDAVDAFVSHVEERVYAGIFSRKEASELYRDARKYWPVKDLFPSPEALKKNIEHRVKNQVNYPVTLPDKKEKPRPKMFKKLPTVT